MFKVFPKNRYWVMQLDLGMSYETPNYCWTSDFIEEIVAELSRVSTARRMSYDMWFWNDRDELDKFITWWTLTHEQ